MIMLDYLCGCGLDTPDGLGVIGNAPKHCAMPAIDDR